MCDEAKADARNLKGEGTEAPQQEQRGGPKTMRESTTSTEAAKKETKRKRAENQGEDEDEDSEGRETTSGEKEGKKGRKRKRTRPGVGGGTPGQTLKPWTAGEIQLLFENLYAKRTPDYTTLASELGRSKCSVSSKAKRLQNDMKKILETYTSSSIANLTSGSKLEK
ncbi:hypothetical protein IE53DRAFT_377539 [Violaceomyces palustris]|uniref:Uncharacterized protein n=1 Tax=Violaceomyces palustris TaxID=1673888 RepID=A0ACD0P5E8_9BASI|nr:hypothetical protein IE53DRAFT_377539 [Violaceomyces palustris]